MGADLGVPVSLARRLAGSYEVRLLGRGEGVVTLFAEGEWCSAVITVSSGRPPPAPAGEGWDYLLLAEGEGVAAVAAFKLGFRERHPALRRLLPALAAALLSGAAGWLGEGERGFVLRAAEALSG